MVFLSREIAWCSILLILPLITVNSCFIKGLPLRFKDKNLYQPVKKIIVQTQCRRDNAGTLYDIIGTSLLNKNIFQNFETFFYLVLDKNNAYYITYKECQTSQIRFIRFI